MIGQFKNQERESHSVRVLLISRSPLHRVLWAAAGWGGGGEGVGALPPIHPERLSALTPCGKDTAAHCGAGRCPARPPDAHGKDAVRVG